MNVTARERMFLLLGAAAVVAIFLFLLVDQWRKSQARISAEREQKELLLAKYERIVQKEPLLRRRLEEGRAALRELHEGLLQGRTAPLAAAELQRLLKEAADRVGLDIKRERILESARDGLYQEIAVEINAMGSLTKLVEFLHRIESTPQQLRIQELQIRGDNFRDPKQMNTKLEVAGYILTSEGAELMDAPPAPTAGANPQGSPQTGPGSNKHEEETATEVETP